jgi:hypothetical protein
MEETEEDDDCISPDSSAKAGTASAKASAPATDMEMSFFIEKWGKEIREFYTLYM